MQTWVCDSCGQPIRQVQDGYVEWWTSIQSNPRTGRGLRLVHHQPASPRGPHGSCQYDPGEARGIDVLSDLPLDSFLGSDGLMCLLSMLAEGWLPTEEVLELIKRLHIPGYEHARFHFERAIAERIFEPNTLPGYYWQRDIQAVLNFVEGQES